MFPSQAAVRFKVSAAMVWLLRFLAVFFLGVVGLGIFALVTDPNSAKEWPVLLATMVFPVGLGVLCWRAAGRARDQIAVDETGIWRLPPKGKPVFIAWCDVGVVRADDVMQRLIVSDRSRAHTIRLEYQLDNFSALRDYVLQRTEPATRAKESGGSVFYRTWINKGIILIVVTFYVAAGAFIFTAGHFAFSAFMFGMAGLTLACITRDPISLTIKSDRAVILYPGWKREIAFRDITSVTLENNAAANGNVWAGVVISIKDRKPLTLYRFRDGSLALLLALQSALNPASSPEKTTEAL